MTENITNEYELTYLAREIPPQIHQTLPVRLVDIYIPDDMAVHPALRLRKEGNSYEITKKVPVSETDRSEMTEQTIPLAQAEFESLTAGHHRLVEKDRYRVVIDGRPAEVDIFSGQLEGLVLIDFEFLSPADKAAFTPPACCLADVTQELAFAGGNLAGRRYADLGQVLMRFAYRPLSL